MSSLLPSTLATLADELVDRCVGLYLAGVKGPKRMAQAIAQEELGPKGEPTEDLIAVVQTVLASARWASRMIEAKANIPGWVQRGAQAATPMALQSVIYLASPANEDKRTRSSNAQFLLAAGAGVTPLQRVQVTADEEFLSLVREIFPSAVAAGEARRRLPVVDADSRLVESTTEGNGDETDPQAQAAPEQEG